MPPPHAPCYRALTILGLTSVGRTLPVPPPFPQRGETLARRHATATPTSHQETGARRVVGAVTACARGAATNAWTPTLGGAARPPPGLCTHRECHQVDPKLLSPIPRARALLDTVAGTPRSRVVLHHSSPHTRAHTRPAGPHPHKCTTHSHAPAPRRANWRAQPNATTQDDVIFDATASIPANLKQSKVTALLQHTPVTFVRTHQRAIFGAVAQLVIAALVASATAATAASGAGQPADPGAIAHSSFMEPTISPYGGRGADGSRAGAELCFLVDAPWERLRSCVGRGFTIRVASDTIQGILYITATGITRLTMRVAATHRLVRHKQTDDQARAMRTAIDNLVTLSPGGGGVLQYLRRLSDMGLAIAVPVVTTGATTVTWLCGLFGPISTAATTSLLAQLRADPTFRRGGRVEHRPGPTSEVIFIRTRRAAPGSYALIIDIFVSVLSDAPAGLLTSICTEAVLHPAPQVQLTHRTIVSGQAPCAACTPLLLPSEIGAGLDIHTTTSFAAKLVASPSSPESLPRVYMQCAVLQARLGARVRASQRAPPRLLRHAPYPPCGGWPPPPSPAPTASPHGRGGRPGWRPRPRPRPRWPRSAPAAGLGPHYGPGRCAILRRRRGWRHPQRRRYHRPRRCGSRRRRRRPLSIITTAPGCRVGAPCRPAARRGLAVRHGRIGCWLYAQHPSLAQPLAGLEGVTGTSSASALSLSSVTPTAHVPVGDHRDTGLQARSCTSPTYKPIARKRNPTWLATSHFSIQCGTAALQYLGSLLSAFLHAARRYLFPHWERDATRKRLRRCLRLMRLGRRRTYKIPGRSRFRPSHHRHRRRRGPRAPPPPRLPPMVRPDPAGLSQLLLKLSTNVAALLNPGPAPIPFDITTWNTRGALYKLRSSIRSLLDGGAHADAGNPPSVVVFTETKLTTLLSRRDNVQQEFSGGRAFTKGASRRHVTFSCADPETRRDAQKPQRWGVCVTVAAPWASLATTVSVPDELRGMVACVDIRRARTGPALLFRIVGVYIPPASSATAAERDAVHQYIRQQCAACSNAAANNTAPYHLVIAGDVNATLHPDDRASGNTYDMDTKWRALVRDCALSPLPEPPEGAGRQHTWVSDPGRDHQSGRIDDILVLPHTLALCPTTQMRVLGQFDSTSDHSPLTAVLDLSSLGVTCPPNEPPADSPAPTATPPRIHLPVPAATLRAACETAAADCGRQLAELEEILDTVAASPLPPLAGADALVQDLDRRVTSIHTTVVDTVAIALNPPGDAHTQATRQAHRRTRPRPVIASTRLARICRHALGAARGYTPAWDTPLWQSSPTITALPPSLRPCPAEALSPTPPVEWAARVRAAGDTARRRANTQARTHATKAASEQRSKLSRLAHTARRKYHRVILGGDTPPLSLTCLTSVDGTRMLTSAGDILPELHAQYTAATDRRGLAVNTPAPWTLPLGPDHQFTPTTLRRVPEVVHGAPPSLATLLAPGAGEAVYHRRLGLAANGRSPGPDGLPNDVLKLMPEAYHRCTLKLFRTLVRIGRVLPSFKVSETVLLHKRGDPTRLSNFRPVGLSNALGKLFTACVADCMSALCEEHGVLSDSQCGFRANLSCTRQLLYHLSVLEDARLYDNDLFVLYLDWANAFGSVPHERLAPTLAALGLPDDFIALVRDLYTDATTCVRVPSGTTTPVSIRCGTLQGDPLSPLLFLLFLEPLIQWIECEPNDGYTLGCVAKHPPLSGSTQRHRTASTGAAADDLALTSSTLDGARRMLRKTELFCEWAAMQQNAPKCALTARLHKPPGGAILDALELARRFTGALAIGGNVIPFVAPTSPVKYLGCHLRLDLDMSDHARALTAEVTHRVRQIRTAQIYDRDIIPLIESLVAPLVSYSIPVCTLTHRQLKQVRSTLARAYADCEGLPKTCAYEALTFPTSVLGLGAPCIDKLLARAYYDALALAATDAGRLRTVASSLLRAHAATVGHNMDLLQAGARGAHANTSPWVQRLTLTHRTYGDVPATIRTHLLGDPPHEAGQPHVARTYEAIAPFCEPPELSRLQAFCRFVMKWSPPTLRNLIDRETGHLLTPHAFAARFGSASALIQSGYTLVHRIHTEQHALRQIIRRTLDHPVARRALPTPNPTTDHQPAHSIERAESLHQFRVHGHRVSGGQLHYLLQPSGGPLNTTTATADEWLHRLTVTRLGPVSLQHPIYKRFWCGPVSAGDTAFLQHPAIAAYNARATTPAPDLTVPQLGPSPRCPSTHIDTLSIDPARDALPTAALTFHTVDTTTAVYGDQGRYAGSLPTACLHRLWERFVTASAGLSPAIFTRSVCALLARPRATQPAMRTDVAQALQQAFIFDAHMFSDPFLAPPGIQYHSNCGADAVFGAHPPALAGAWSGSVLFLPPKDDALAALLHASACAARQRGPAPFLALGILPARAGTNHAEYAAADPLVYSLGTFKCTTLFTPAAPDAPHAPKYSLLLIANLPGVDQYNTLRDSPHGRALARTLHIPRLPRLQPAALERQTAQHLRAKHARWCNRITRAIRSRTFTYGAPETQHTPHTTPTPPFEGPNIPHRTRGTTVPALLRFARTTMVYTDASVLNPPPPPSSPGTGRGCGIHVPEGVVPDTSFPFTGTILHGELTSILWAILHAGGEGNAPLHIATDSMVSLFLIRAGMHTPHKIRQSSHRKLILAIRRAIEAREGPVRLWHVRAHRDCAGNNKADALARAAARGMHTLANTPEEVHIPMGTDAAAQLRTFQDVADVARVRAATTHIGTKMARMHPANAKHFTFDAAASDAFRRTRAGPCRRTALRYRFGCALKCDRTTPCAMCGHTPCHNGHHLGACTDADIKHLQTTFHHRAVAAIVTALSRGAHGGSTIIADAGVTAPSGEAHNNTIGPLLPGYRLKPDIVMMVGWPQSRFDNTPGTGRWPAAGSTDVTIAALEFCFGNDFYLPGTLRRKQYKYTPLPGEAPPPPPPTWSTGIPADSQATYTANLLTLLRTRGYTALGEHAGASQPSLGYKLLSTSGERLPVLAIGRTGAVLCHYTPMLRDLGLSRASTSKLLRELNILAAKRAQAIADAVERRTQIRAAMLPDDAAPFPSLRPRRDDPSDGQNAAGGGNVMPDAPVTQYTASSADPRAASLRTLSDAAHSLQKSEGKTVPTSVHRPVTNPTTLPPACGDALLALVAAAAAASETSPTTRKRARSRSPTGETSDTTPPHKHRTVTPVPPRVTPLPPIASVPASPQETPAMPRRSARVATLSQHVPAIQSPPRCTPLVRPRPDSSRSPSPRRTLRSVPTRATRETFTATGTLPHSTGHTAQPITTRSRHAPGRPP